MLKNFIQQALKSRGYYLRSTTHFGDDYWQDLVTLQAKRAAPAKVIFDVGAHHGETLGGVLQYFSKAVLHCFEPDPDSFGILVKAAEGKPNVHLHPLALGAEAGVASFNRNSESMTNSLLPSSTESLEGENAHLVVTHNQIEVPVKTLDKVCEEAGLEGIDILKTDCQGYDLMVLQGALGMISKGKIGLITCEVIFDHEYEGQGKHQDILALMDSHGYKFMGFYNMARNRENECTFCDAIFMAP